LQQAVICQMREEYGSGIKLIKTLIDVQRAGGGRYQ